MDPISFFRDDIFTWEDGSSLYPTKTLSLDRDDAGNWSTGIAGQGVLTGSNHGVTPIVLAGSRGVPVAAITPAVMRALTLDEAAKIGETRFYHGTGLDKLPWDAVIASAADFGWGAGPFHARQEIQRMIAVGDDGDIGLFTQRAYGEFIASHGIEEAARLWQARRNAYYQKCVAARPVNAKFLKGWMNRSAYFAPGTPWWARFNAPLAKAA